MSYSINTTLLTVADPSISLVVLAEHLKGSVPTPVAIAGIAAGSFAVSSVASIIIRKIPVVGKLVVG